MKDLAKGLASLGRNGDSTLVHMQPGEVAGLQALAKSQGTSLTVNPNTGLPEAFNLGNVFSSLLPTIVGAALAPSTGGASLFGSGMLASAAPIVGGALTGAALASAKGEDPLMGGLTGGFGGYGGSQLGGSLAKMGAGQAAAPASTGAANTGYVPSVTDVAQNPTGFQQAANLNAGLDVSAGIPPTDLTPAYELGAKAGFAQTPPIPSGLENMTSNIQNMATGAKNLMGMGDMSMGQAYDAFKTAGGSASQLGMPLGMAALSGLEPSDIYGKPLKNKEDKYDPYATLNLSGSTGLKLFADGGSVQSGGLRDLYGTSDSANIGAISADGYGIGRLNQLANQTDMTRAQNYMYAEGGDVKEPTLNLNTANQEPETARFNMASFPPLAMAAFGRRNPSDYGISPMAMAANPFLARLFGAQAPTGSPVTGLNLESGKQETRYIAKGGYLDGMGDGMSDSIPASIEGKQPARLADGEFVVPADVVSHIGNGSSKAGAKRLYSMLDRVREARTGTKKQGKEINPKKYMPA